MLVSGEQPNAVTYTSLLIMWSKSRLPEAKENILRVRDLHLKIISFVCGVIEILLERVILCSRIYSSRHFFFS